MMKISALLRNLAVAATCSFVAACGGGHDDNLDDRADLADPKMRFVHAIPGGPDVTLRRNGRDESDASDVGYLDGSQYHDIGRGTAAFSLVSGPLDSEIATASFDALRGDKYTLVAVPDAAGADLIVIDDPYNKSVVSDDARLRVFNASPNAIDVDVYLTKPGVALAGVAPTFASVAYRESVPESGDDSLDVERGTYLLRITAAGLKTPIFSATVDVPKNGDWLLFTVPVDDPTPATGDIRVLRLRSDDSDDATDLIDSD